MLRLRSVVSLAVLLLALGAGPGALAGEETPGRGSPAVTVGEPNEVEEDEAWTFRYLVPTLLAMSAAGLALTGLAYARRIKARYRVVR